MRSVAALPHERHCLLGGDLLIALVEIRRGVPVASVLLDSYRDRREYLRELEERPQGDLHEVVNRYPTKQLTDSVDLRCTPSVAAALLQLGFLGHPLGDETTVFLVKRQSVSLLDLALGHPVRAACQIDVVITGIDIEVGRLPSPGTYSNISTLVL